MMEKETSEILVLTKDTGISETLVLMVETEDTSETLILMKDTEISETLVLKMDTEISVSDSLSSRGCSLFGYFMTF
jgi:D-serine dehydratase